MQKERNAAYIPDLYVEDFYMEMMWDSNGILCNSVDIDGLDKNNIDLNNLNKLPSIKIYNIGEGTAKDIKFNWSNKYMEQWIDLLDKDGGNIQYKNGNIIIDNKGVTELVLYPEESQTSFLRNNENSTIETVFPYAFQVLLKEWVITHNVNEKSGFVLSSEYKDIQDLEYSKSITLVPEVVLSCQTDDGGYCKIRFFTSRSERYCKTGIYTRAFIIGTIRKLVVAAVCIILTIVLFDILKDKILLYLKKKNRD